MRCFYHPETDAVGICKNCQKGLCMECAADVGNGLACKNRCEEEVKTTNKLREFSKITYRTSITQSSSVGTAIYVVIGLLLLAVAILDAGKSPVGWAVGAVSMVFLFMAGSYRAQGQKIKQYLQRIDKKP